jgi:transcriptional regulator with XRE-family HTH domain
MPNMTLDQFLTKKRISTTEFADKIGMHQTSIWRIRNGKQRPDWDAVERIMAATKGAVTANDFVAKP